MKIESLLFFLADTESCLSVPFRGIQSNVYKYFIRIAASFIAMSRIQPASIAFSKSDCEYSKTF